MYTYCKVNSAEERDQLLYELEHHTPYKIRWHGISNKPTEYAYKDPTFKDWLFILLSRTLSDHRADYSLLHTNYYTSIGGDKYLSVEEFRKFINIESDEGIYKK